MNEVQQKLLELRQTGTATNISTIQPQNDVQKKLLEIRSANPPVDQTSQDQAKQILMSSQTPQQSDGSFLPTAKKITGGLLSGAADIINKGYEKFTQLPVIKQAAGTVGNIVGTTGEVLGAGIGAVGETVHQTFRAAEGKGFDAGQILKSANKTAEDTGGFGHNIGEAALPASLLGGAGKALNLMLAYGQGYSGYKDLVEGYKNKDWARMAQGSEELAVSLMGAKGSLKNKGIFVDPAFKENVRGLSDRLKNEVKSKYAGAKEVITATPKEETMATFKEQDINKATEQFNKALNLRKTELSNYTPEQRNKFVKLAVEENAPIGRQSADPTKLDTNTTTVPNLRSSESKIEDTLQEVLNQQKGNRNINLEEIRKDAYKSISENKYKSPLSQEKMKKIVDDEIDAKIRQNNDSPMIDAPDANTFKRSLNYVFDSTSPDKQPALKSLRSTLRKEVENKVDSKVVKSLNQRLGLYEEAVGFFENLNGRAIKGSPMIRILERTGGHIGGAIAGGVVGHPLLGYIAGGELGSKLGDLLNNPEKITTAAIKDFQRAGIIPEDVKTISQAKEYISELQNLRSKTPLLSAPKPTLPGVGGSSANKSGLLSQQEILKQYPEYAGGTKAPFTPSGLLSAPKGEATGIPILMSK